MENIKNLATLGEAELQELCLPLVIHPNPALWEPSLSVPEEAFGTEALAQQIARQYATMRMNNGVGIAAVQMATDAEHASRVIVYQLGPDATPKWIINPVVIEKSGEQEFEEGCLSLPTVFYTKTRSKTIRIAHRTFEGEHMDSTFTGFEAVVVQHEMEHLDGKTFIDDLSFLKKARAKKKVANWVREHKLKK